MSKLEGRGADVSSGAWRTAIAKLEVELGTRGAEFFNLLNTSPKFCRSFAKSAVEMIDADSVKRKQRAVSRPQSTLIHKLFVPTDVQIANMRGWNKKFGWGITEEQFASLPAAPVWPEEKLVAVTLVYYPSAHGGMTEPQTWVESWWKVLHAVHRNPRRWESISTDIDHLRTLSGSMPVPSGSLKWEVIDLAAHWDKENGMKPQDKVGKGSVHVGVLASAAHHKKWAQSLDGVNVPYPVIGGFQLTIPGHGAWTRLPYLSWHQGDRQLELDASYASIQGGYWSVPAFRE